MCLIILLARDFCGIFLYKIQPIVLTSQSFTNVKGVTKLTKHNYNFQLLMPIIKYNEQEFHLSHDEEDKLNQFQQIATFSEDDLPLIIKLLQNHGWNLEAAISRYFDGNWKDNLNSVLAPPSQNDQTPPIIPERIPTPLSRDTNHFGHSTTNQYMATNFVASLPTVNRLPDDYKDVFQLVGLNKRKDILPVTNPIMYILLLIPNACIKILSFIYSFFNGTLFGYNSNRPNTVFKVPRFPIVEEDPLILDHIIKDDISSNKIKEIVKGPHMPFNDALKKCEEEYKMMLVILVGDLNRKEEVDLDDKDNETNNADTYDINSEKFLNRVLGDPGVIKILEDYKDDMVVYLGSVYEVEPWLVARDLHVKYTPECLLVANVLNSNGSVNGVSRLSVLSKLRTTSSKRFQNSLKLTIDKYNPELVVSRTEMEELKLSRQIKHSQEEAYLESLKKDQLKEQKKLIALEEERKQEELKTQKEIELKTMETLKNLHWLNLCLGLLNKSPIESINEGPFATLQIRTSQGNRLIKKFDSKTTLHSIYANIGCHLFLGSSSTNTDEWAQSIRRKIKELTEDETVLCFKNTDLIEDEIDYNTLRDMIMNEINKWDKTTDIKYEMSFNFELISPFPRYKVPTDKTITVRDVSQLWPNGSLLVEDIVEEGSDEEPDE